MSFRFWSYVEFRDNNECWPWTGCTTANGYGRASRDGGANVLAHRRAYELVFGAIPDGLVVLHQCDTPACVNPAHLRIGTQHDNMLDCVAKGRAARGEKNGRAKLSTSDVRAIRRATRRALSFREIANAFGVSTKTISRINRATTWKHITSNPERRERPVEERS